MHRQSLQQLDSYDAPQIVIEDVQDDVKPERKLTSQSDKTAQLLQLPQQDQALTRGLSTRSIGTQSLLPPRTSSKLQSISDILERVSYRVVASDSGTGSKRISAFKTASNTSLQSDILSSQVRQSQTLSGQRTALPSDLLLAGDGNITDQHALAAVKLEGNSLYYFGSDSPTRLFCQRLIHQKYFNLSVMLLIFVNWIIYTTKVYPKQTVLPYKYDNSWQFWSLVMLFIMYSFELMAKIIVNGFMFAVQKNWSTLINAVIDAYREKRSIKLAVSSQLNPRAFVMYVGNGFDLAVVLSFWLSLLLDPTNSVIILIFRAISSMRPARLLRITRGISVFSTALMRSYKLVNKLGVFIFYFYIIYGIVGVQLFRGSLSRKCVYEQFHLNGSVTNMQANPGRSCGSSKAANGTLLQFKYTTEYVKGYACPYPQVCKVIDITDNRPDGFITFDNIVASMLTMFQSSSEQGWTDTMYYAMDSEYVIAYLYFVFMILLVTFMLLNMLVAIISDTFSIVRQQYQEELNEELRNRQTLKQYGDNWSLSQSQNSIREPTRFQIKFRNVLKSPWYKWTTVLFCVGALLILICQKQLTTTQSFYILWIGELIMSLYFVFDVSLQLVSDGQGILGFLQKPKHCFDFINATVTIIILIPGLYRTYLYDYLTFFHIIKFYKCLSAFTRTRKIVKAAFGNYVDVVNVVVFFLMVLAVFATIGMQVLGGNYNMLDPKLPNGNFDSFPEAFLACFQVMVSDNWIDLMYSAQYKFKNSFFGYFVASLYFVMLFTMAHYVTVDLSVAVLLENFEMEEEAKRFGQVVQIVDKLERAGAKAEATYFSKFNPFKYLPASPKLLFARLLPYIVAAKVRAQYFVRFSIGYVEQEVAAIRRQRLNRLQIFATNIQRWYYLNIKKDLKYKYQVNMTAYNSSSKKDPGADVSNDTLDSAAEAVLTKNKIAALIVEKTDQRLVTHINNNPNVDILNSAFDESQVKGIQDNYLQRSEAIEDFNQSHPLYDASYFIFGPQNSVRVWCTLFIGQKDSSRRLVFNRLIAFFVLVSTVLLAVNTPSSRHTNLMNTLNAFTQGNATLLQSKEGVRLMQRSDYPNFAFFGGENVLIIVFSGEFIVKTIVDGAILSPNAYFANGWNILDFIVLFSMWFSVLARDFRPTGFPRLIRATRALRPLRLIPQFEGMKNVIEIIIASSGQIFDALCLLLLFMMPYATFGMTLFYDLFKSCNDVTVSGRSTCIGTYTDAQGLLKQRVWGDITIYNSFNGYGAALLSLFEMLFEEGWMSKLFAGIQNNGVVGSQPQWPPQSPWNAVYFMVWMMLGYVVMRNLFVGVILQAFMTKDGTALLTKEQRSWLNVQKKLKEIRPTKKRLPVGKSRFQTWCFRMVKDKGGPLARTMVAVGILNLALQLTELQVYDRLANGDIFMVHKDLLIREVLSLVFIACYLAETIIKFTGLGYNKWQRNPWHLLDSFGLAGLVPICLIRLFDIDKLLGWEQMCSQLQKLLLDVFVFKLIQQIPLLSSIFKTIRMSSGSVTKVLGVILIAYATFALVCMELFGLTKFGSTSDVHANFRNFGWGMLTLYRMTTGEGWNGIFSDMRVEAPNCIVDPYNYLLSDCGSLSFATLIFVSFEVIMTLMLLGLFIVTIIDNFDASQDDSSVRTIITADDLSQFKRLWSEYDPSASGYIDKSSLVKFLTQLQGNFNLNIYPSSVRIPHLIAENKAYAMKKQPNPKKELSGGIKNVLSQEFSGDGHVSKELSGENWKRIQRTAELKRDASATSSSDIQHDFEVTVSAPTTKQVKKASVPVSSPTVPDFKDMTRDSSYVFNSVSNQPSQDFRNVLSRDSSRQQDFNRKGINHSKSMGVATLRTYSTGTSYQVPFDFAFLSESMKKIDPQLCRYKRHQLNQVYHELLSHDIPDVGIPFEQVLRVLAFSIIDYQQCLKVDQMFTRLQELKKVEYYVALEKVHCLIMTWALRRRFKKYMAVTSQLQPQPSAVHQQFTRPVSQVREISQNSFDKQIKKLTENHSEVDIQPVVQIPVIVVEDDPSELKVRPSSAVSDSLDASFKSGNNSKAVSQNFASSRQPSSSRVSWMAQQASNTSLAGQGMIGEVSDDQCKTIIDTVSKNTWI